MKTANGGVMLLAPPRLLAALLLLLAAAAATAVSLTSVPSSSHALDSARSLLMQPKEPKHHEEQQQHLFQQLLRNCSIEPLFEQAAAASPSPSSPPDQEQTDRLAAAARQRLALEAEISGPALRAQRELERALDTRRGAVAAAETARRAAAERGDWAASAELDRALAAAERDAARAQGAVADAYARRGRLGEIWRALDAVEAGHHEEGAAALGRAAAAAEAIAEHLLAQAREARSQARARRSGAAASLGASKLRSRASALRSALARAHALAERAVERAADAVGESDEAGRRLVGALAARDLAQARAGGVAAEALGASAPVREHAGLAAALGDFRDAEDLKRAASHLEHAEARGAGAAGRLSVGGAEAERRAREHAREREDRLARLRGASRAAERLLDLGRWALGLEMGDK